MNNRKYTGLAGFFFLLLISLSVHGQQRVSLEELLMTAEENNFQYTLNQAQVRKAELESEGANEVPKTGIFFENEDMRPSDKNGEWKLGIEQNIPWPGLNKARRNYTQQLTATHQINSRAISSAIKRDVKKAYYELWYLEDKKKLFLQLDSIYKNMFDAATIRYNVGDVAGLDKISAEVKYREVQTLLQQLERDILTQQRQLMLLTNQQTYYLPLDLKLEKIKGGNLPGEGIHPSLLVQQQNIEVSKSMIDVQKKMNSPELSARAFSQTYLGMKDPLSGFAVNFDFPLFGTKPMKKRLEALEADVELQMTELKWQQINLDNQKEKTEILLDREQLMLDFYEESGLGQAEAIISASTLSYRSGEISFAELSQFIAQAISIKQNYLDALNEYNRAMIEYLYLTDRN